MDLFNKVHTFEPTKSHIYEPNISLISVISLMFNYAKPRMSIWNLINFEIYKNVLVIYN